MNFEGFSNSCNSVPKVFSNAVIFAFGRASWLSCSPSHCEVLLDFTGFLRALVVLDAGERMGGQMAEIEVARDMWDVACRRFLGVDDGGDAIVESRQRHCGVVVSCSGIRGKAMAYR